MIDYEQKMALKEELYYFVNHFDGHKPEIANGDHALEVTEILIKASNHLENK